MTARARLTQHPRIVPDCPVCGLPLPPVVVDVDGQSDGGRMWSLELAVQELDGPWWDAAERDHPSCGVQLAQRRYRRDAR